MDEWANGRMGEWANGRMDEWTNEEISIGNLAVNILLLEPYCSGSHRAWAEGYVAHSRHDVTLLALPTRFWKWRMQGGAVTLAEQVRALSLSPILSWPPTCSTFLPSWA